MLKLVPGVAIGVGLSYLYAQMNKINRLEKKTEKLGELLGELSGAVATDMENLMEEVNTEFHEVYVTIANNRYGDNED